MAARWKGLRKVRQTLKRLPDEVRGEMIVEFNQVGPEFVARIQGRTPLKTGALRSGIKFRVLPRVPKLQVGILGTPSARSKLFYGRILEFGRKAQTKEAKRRGPGGARSTYTINVGSIAPKRFVTGAMPDLRKRVGDSLRRTYERALRKAAGASSDGF